MLPGDIYTIKIDYGAAHDRRPCMILEDIGDGSILVLRFSSHMSLFDPLKHLKISASEPDFHLTGLKKDSYLDDEIIKIRSSELVNYMGKFEGELLRKVNDWIGPL